MTALAQLTLAPAAVVGMHKVTVADANDLLAAWGHYLGPCRRPFRQEGWVLVAHGAPVAVAVSASTVSTTVADYPRGEVVELARLCSAEAWATRVMVRLWREIAAPTWQGWPVRAAVAYSQNNRHDGRTYRFDGWTRATARAGSGGGGTWTHPRTPGAPGRGTKTLWVWHYDQAAQP